MAVWRGLLEVVANTVGIAYAPSALFAVAFGFVLALLLHFSLVISRLTDQNKVLAQRWACCKSGSTTLEAGGDAQRDREPARVTRDLTITR